MPAATSVATEDTLKLLLMVIIGGGLLALGRWSSQLGGRRIGDAPADEPTPDAHAFSPVEASPKKVWPPSSEEVAASLPFDPSLGKLQIRKLFFKKTDVVPGPIPRFSRTNSTSNSTTQTQITSGGSRIS